MYNRELAEALGALSELLYDADDALKALSDELVAQGYHDVEEPQSFKRARALLKRYTDETP